MLGAKDTVEVKRAKLRLQIAKLEADLAYFLAQLEFIGEPITTNQAGQILAFKTLQKSIGSRVIAAKQARQKLF